MLPAIVRAGIPTVDVVLSCHPPEMPCAGGAGGGPGGGPPEVGFEGNEVPGPAPHPHSSRRTESSQGNLDERSVADFIVQPPVNSEVLPPSRSVDAQNGRPASRDIGAKSLEAQWEASGLRLFLF